jgi:pimeloyl-ACP methyl ester carboxylesterase
MSVQEQIHQLHASKQLFGLISTPTADDNHLPWVLFINAGSAYHIGPGRIHVTMARQLASAGYPCLRMDVSGLGESPPDGDRAANDCYAASSFNDVALAMDYLQTLDARRKIVLVGICSGAYVAFQGAAQYTHAALMASIVMNPLTYFWREGMSLNEAPNEKARVWHRYRDAIFNPSKWLRLLSGKTHLSIGQAARAAMRLLVPSRRLAMQSCTHNNSTQSSWGHPATQNLAADLMKVRSNQRKLVLIVSEEEPGHFLLMNQAKKEAEQLLAEGSLHVEFIANADHTFSTQSAREALRSALLAQLQGMLN